MSTAKTAKKPNWKRNLTILWFGTFMTGMGFSEVIPFISLYIDELGEFSKSELTTLSSLVFAVTFLTTAIVSPMWGRLADKYGRKPMLLRASFAMAIIIGAMGFVTNVWELFILRALQGALGGYISNANAFVAANTPKQDSGRAISFLVTGITAGNLIGPFIGGTISSFFSYRQTFILTGVLLFIAFLLSLLLHENFHASPSTMKTSSKDIFNHLPNKRLIVSLFVTTIIIQIVNTSINPFVALFVRELNHNGSNTTFLAGVVAAMPGIATIIAAPYFGRLGEKIGAQKILLYGLIFAFAVQLPTGFATSVIALIIFRFLIGISDATMLPQVNTMLAVNTPPEMISRVFAYNQSFMSIGNVLGPMFGTLVANTFDYNGVFIAGSLLIAINFVWFLTNQLKIKANKPAK